mmetsp:Transcript_5967/g.8774  ORF Transcript_5967/g.8774 Transcript_5967/m.8774 type:complete len:1344 (+) Transcript_5967:109-4140(+)
MSGSASIVQQRLCDVVDAHRSTLARLSVESKPCFFRTDTSHAKRNNDSGEQPTTEHDLTTIEAAQMRSNKSNHRNDASSTVADIQLNPPERAAPQDLLDNCHINTKHHGIRSAEQILMRDDDDECNDNDNNGDQFLHCDVYKMTIKTITVLSMLTEEVDELYHVAFNKYLPQLSLFGSDLKLEDGMLSELWARNGNVNGKRNDVDELDEDVMNQRDSELLRRVGKFMVVLQETYNLQWRCEKLVKNLVHQIHGCRSMWHMHHEDDYFEEGSDSAPISCLEEDGISRLGMEVEAEMNPEAALFENDDNLIPIAESICQLLNILINIDSVVANNAELLEAWDLYKSVVAGKDMTNDGNSKYTASPVEVVNVQQSEFVPPETLSLDDPIECDSANGGPSKQQLIKLECMMMQLDFTLLSSRSFIVAIEQNFDRGRLFDNSTDGIESTVVLHEIIRNLVLLLSEKYCQGIETDEERRDERKSMVGVYGLYCLHRHLLPSSKAPDVKTFRLLCDNISRCCPILPLYGELPFFPLDFLTRYAPLDRTKVGSAKMRDIQITARGRLSKLDSAFVVKVETLYKDALVWMANAEARMPPSEIISGYDAELCRGVKIASTRSVLAIKQIVDFVLKGIALSRLTVKTLRTYLLLHKNLKEAIPSSHLLCIEKLITALKGIEAMLRGRWRPCIILMHKAGVKVLASQLFDGLENLRSYVDHHQGTPTQMSRIEASLAILESLLKSSSTFSSTRMHAIKSALYACVEESSRKEDGIIDIKGLESLRNNLDVFSNIDIEIVDSCDCAFLFFHSSLCVPLFRHIYQSSKCSNIVRLTSVLDAFSDASHGILRSSKYLDYLSPSPLYLRQFRKYLLEEIILKEVISPVVEDIDCILRHRIHAKNIEEMSSLNTNDLNMGDFLKFVDHPPLQFCGLTLDMKATIEKLLSETLYNSSTVGLRDTNSHNEMAALAESYGLSLIDNLLPAGTGDQGLDLVYIADHFTDFMSRYKYNLNHQIFVECTSSESGRYLSIVDIDAVAMSLSRHGLGVMHRIEDTTNHFLSQSMDALFCGLSNEIFVSSILKEERWFNGQQKGSNTSYPYERALAFRRELSEVLNSDGSSTILEMCRTIVTEIGNTLGLLRLSRTSDIYRRHQSRQYDIFLSESKKENHYSHSDVSKYNERNTVSRDSLLKKSTNVIREAYTESNFHDIESFYILYPVLSLSWLDASLRGKGMLRKKINTSDGYYTDDGFALGCSFLFNTFGQSINIEELNWHQSFRQQSANDKTTILRKIAALETFDMSSMRNKSGSQKFQSRRNTSNSIDNETTRLKVSARHMEMKRREMELLQMNLHSPSIILGV